MLELLKQRCSIRKYKDQPIEAEKIEKLKEAILLSPSSRDFCPWEFIFVQDKNILNELSTAKEHGSAFIKDAALAIVVCGDQNKSDVWVEDCSIASLVAHLTATSLGLGSCWVQIHHRMHAEHMTSNHYLKEILNLPDGIAVESIIAIGYADEQPEKNKTAKPDLTKIHNDKW